MSVQVIRPAGAGHETLYVFLLALAIVLLAAVVVAWRAESEQSVAIASDQLDARRDLNAAEQGIHIDLLVALDEIQLYQEEEQALPEPQRLAEEGFPPFIAGASAANRGGHAWQLLQSEAAAAYFGRSAATEVAGSFLLRLDGEEASVWLKRAAVAESPNDLREQALTAAGWRQVVSQFDAGRYPPTPPLTQDPLMSTLHRSPLRCRLLAAVLICLSAALLPALASAAEGKRLRIGITLHPYYSYVSNIVGDKAEVVPLIPAGFNPHAYEPRAEDIKRIGGLDVVVLNGVGHDDFAERMIAASEKPDVALIEANVGVPLLAATGQAARGAGKVVNPHTFLSISASIAQINTIARELGKLDPDNAQAYRKNARAYGKRLRTLRAEALGRLSQEQGAELRVATIHGAYDYLLREFGLEVTAVVEPAHGIEPSPSQLKKTIDQLRELDVQVIFSEMDFPSTYVETIQRESGVHLYPLTHISYGEYTARKYEEEMTRNLDTVVRAIQENGA